MENSGALHKDCLMTLYEIDRASPMLSSVIY